MRIQATQSTSFGYSHPLKTMWKKGVISGHIKKGFYGERLTMRNISLEHLKPKSQKGETKWHNLVLASNKINNERGDKPLSEYINYKAMGEYLDQFKNIKVKGFDGNKYIATILETVGGLLNV
jgi:hypothetical protein